MNRLLVSLITIAAFATALPAVAQTPASDPAAIFAAEHAAVGGAAWDRIAEIVEKGTFDGQGLTGPYTMYADPKSGFNKAIFTVAGIVQGSGYDAHGSWSQQNGLVEPLEDPASVATAKTGAYIARNGWWNPAQNPAAISYTGSKQDGGKTYDVIHVVPDGGNPVDVWIDAATHLIFKTVQTDRSNTITTTTYSDYRETSGVMYPFATLTNIGDPKYDQRTAVKSVDFSETLAQADLERPQNQRNGTIAGGTSVTIPFELGNPDRGHIVIVARVNGSRPLHMIFDTGGSNVLTPEVAKEIGLHGSGAIAGGGAGEEHVSFQLAGGATLSIGGATMKEQQFVILPLPQADVHESGRFTVDGIVGYEVLKNFVVSIDYVNKRLTLTQPNAFRYTGGGTGISFKSATIPVIPVTIGGVTGPFMVDTGNGFYNTISKTFVQSNNLPVEASPVVVQSSGNVGGAIRSPLARLQSVKIGPYTIARPVFEVTNTKSGALAGTAFAGNIGAAILSRFDVTFDYANSVIYLKPNANFAKPFVGTIDGMSLFRPDAATLEVSYVNPKSPAAKAGLRAGDRIVAVEGVTVRPLGADDLLALEKKQGTLVVTYVRDGTTHTGRLVLGEMIP
jgi:hypothetical protein